MTQETTIHESPGGRILEYPTEGSPLGNVSSSLEMIAAARSQDAEWIAVPIERLGEEFFQLGNGIVGEVLQKFVSYHLRVAILGEILSLSGPARRFMISWLSAIVGRPCGSYATWKNCKTACAE